MAALREEAVAEHRSGPSRWLTAALVLSSAAITVLGVYTVLEVFGISPGG
ncbi:hypothetical protein GCM10027271_40260 [Saccharopolyspora gloriosae]|uniref:Uncharacterized protein n=1 Tax=Saccharopolyspora gloriosae TaxID=455344 RepID=A0A840NG75_9PSEU|nr:hypothetical protein [Saccharopolyspora gloriosae]MBB5069085.1 hypothetical protein [Saccharopolyspora gloriosae]